MKKILIIVSTLLIVLNLSACSSDKEFYKLSGETQQSNQYSKLVVNQISNINRAQEVVTDPENSSMYSIPGNGVNVTTTNEKTAVLNENTEIFNFDSLTSEGFYVLNDIESTTKLYKHRGADSQVETYLLDDTAVSKNITLRNNIYPTSQTVESVIPVNVTGLYAPAGEIIKIEISKELAALNPKVYIGSTASNGEVNNIAALDTYSRMPNRVKEITLSSTVNYVGSPLGGQIYLQANTEEYSATITGGVEYLHYILGTTTKEELTRLYTSSAPMIDIEIPNHLRINMPRAELTAYENTVYNSLTDGLTLTESEEETYKAQAVSEVIDSIIEVAEQWKMYGELSANICPEDLYRSNNITLFYDSYNITNSSSNKNYITNSLSNGRNLFDLSIDHIYLLEAYNLHFWNNDIFVEQGSSEITSKVLSILSYTLYSTYGQLRTSTSTPTAHSYSNAADTLNLLTSTGNSFEIAKYVALIHSFGPELFIEAITYNCDEIKAYDRLFVQLSNVTGLNMEYYFTNILGWSITNDLITDISSRGYEMYIPVASRLQIGQVHNGVNVYSAQPYGAFDTEIININESIVVPEDMEFEILGVSETIGALTKVDNEYFYSTNLEEIDEFTVIIKVYNSEVEYTTSLIMGIVTQHSGVMNSNVPTNFYQNPEGLSLDDYNENELTIETTINNVTSSSIKYSVALGYNAIFVTYAEIYFPETKDYTLVFAGLGDIKVSIGDSHNDLEEVARFKVEGTSSSYTEGLSSNRTYTISATANTRVSIKVEVSSVAYNSGERIEYYIGYQTGSTVNHVPDNWWYRQYSSSKDPIYDYYTPYNTESLYTSENTLSSYNRISEDLNIIYQTGVLDDKFLTTPNSSSQSMDPNSIVIYKYHQEVTANYFALTSASDTTGVLSFFEIHVSDNGVDWTEAFNGLNPMQSYNCMALNDGYSFKYVKLVFLSNYSGNYIDICNFEFQLRYENAQVLDMPDGELSYSGNAFIELSNSNLNNNIVVFDDTIKFTFTGSALILFANTSKEYGVIEVKINDSVYTVDLSSDQTLFSQQVLAIGCLDYDRYEVTITVLSGTGNLDYIAVA